MGEKYLMQKLIHLNNAALASTEISATSGASVDKQSIYPLADDKILCSPKLKAFADDILIKCGLNDNMVHLKH